MVTGSIDALGSRRAPLPEAATTAMQRCAHELLLRSHEVAAEVTTGVLARLPGLVPEGAPDALDSVRESTEQNIGTILSTLAFGVPATVSEPPLGTIKLLRHSVAAGGDITVLLQAYRYGHELLWQAWSAHVGARLTDAEVLREVLGQSSAHIFTFIDCCCQQLVDVYRAEFGTLPPPDATAPADLVRALLGDGPVDETAAGATLRLDVRAHHLCLALSPIEPGGDVRRALDALTSAAGASDLTLPVGDGTWWAWLSWPARPDDGVLARLAAVPLTGVLAGMGGVGRGRAGFRASHAQAREADAAARLGSRVRAGVVRHRDVELAAVLCADVERARRLANDRLGALSSADETCDRLRETLLAYLAQGCSKTRTAAVLHVHLKTVSYRLAQAEALLGRSLSEDVLELGAALLIDKTLRVR